MGRSDLAEATPAELLRLESERNDRRFAALDKFIRDISRRMLEGSQPLTWTIQGGRPTKVEYPWLTGSERSQLNDLYDPEAIQRRGGWFLPTKATVGPGWISLFRFIDAEPRFAINNARNIRGKPHLRTWEAVLTWSLTNRIAEDFYEPFEIRGPQAGKVSGDRVRKRFASYQATLAALEIRVGDKLTPFLPGNGWSRRKAEEKAELRVVLRRALYEGWGEGSARLYRAWYLAQLISRYYKLAGSDGRALRRRVITKQYSPHLVALFGGDWIEFLDYIGEQPHSDEEVVQVLPTANLYVADRKRIEDVAIATGAEHGEVARIAAALFAGEVTDSPIEDRLELLADIWQQFDQAHASQQSGLRPLPNVPTYELLAFDFVKIDSHLQEFEPTPIESVLRTDTIEKVNRLWGTALFDRWPERLYTEVLPFKHVAQALGPAFEFWHGVGLTTWYFTEGPSSRTDIAGMPEYYSKLIDRLEKVKHPIDPRLFKDLAKAEKRLGPPEDIVREIGSAGPLSFSITSGQRREGFGYLRDVVTKHRRVWAEQHLEAYLQRWRDCLREVHSRYHRRIADAGRKPTARQFSQLARDAANQWFGGDLGRVYAVIGETSPIDPVYERLMPANVAGFAQTVFHALGGRPLERFTVQSPTDEKGNREERESIYQAADCARGAIRFIQCREAKGEDPTIPEFGTTKWKRFSDLFGEDGWHRFVDVVDQELVKSSASESVPPQVPLVSQPSRPAASTNHQPTSPVVPQADGTQVNLRKKAKRSIFHWLLRR